LGSRRPVTKEFKTFAGWTRGVHGEEEEGLGRRRTKKVGRWFLTVNAPKTTARAAGRKRRAEKGKKEKGPTQKNGKWEMGMEGRTSCRRDRAKLLENSGQKGGDRREKRGSGWEGGKRGSRFLGNGLEGGSHSAEKAKYFFGDRVARQAE